MSYQDTMYNNWIFQQDNPDSKPVRSSGLASGTNKSLITEVIKSAQLCREIELRSPAPKRFNHE